MRHNAKYRLKYVVGHLADIRVWAWSQKELHISSLKYIWDANMAITFPEDVPVHISARLSSGTIMTKKLDVYSKFEWLT